MGRPGSAAGSGDGGEPTCLLDKAGPGDLVLELSDKAAWEHGSQASRTVGPGEKGLYVLLYCGCPVESDGGVVMAEEEHKVSFKLRVAFWNEGIGGDRDYLSAGSESLPELFLGTFVLFSAALVVWARCIRRHPSQVCVKEGDVSCGIVVGRPGARRNGSRYGLACEIVEGRQGGGGTACLVDGAIEGRRHRLVSLDAPRARPSPAGALRCLANTQRNTSVYRVWVRLCGGEGVCSARACVGQAAVLLNSKVDVILATEDSFVYPRPIMVITRAEPPTPRPASKGPCVCGCFFFLSSTAL